MPAEGLVLLDMPEVKLLNILRKTCKLISGPHGRWKFDSQAIEASNSPIFRTNRTLQNKDSKMGTCDTTGKSQIISDPAQIGQQTKQQVRH